MINTEAKQQQQQQQTQVKQKHHPNLCGTSAAIGLEANLKALTHFLSE